ncbi:hypothetical protein J5J86_24250 [Aquabacter sp. L1I39]|uniref:DUF883 family protein n=1 Tax=Aquabacter sp. L1I39 TaxID=2820278 RepID=UPI001ADA8D4C|nr:hypothetical protein [Aquabacter sp. L1I39]QTL03790.1 hypothetical protein J5J86_24250 [Aquabacter sp. L1I39]
MVDNPSSFTADTNGTAKPGDALAELRSDLAALKADLAQLTDTLGKTARDGVKGATTEAEVAMGEVTDWAEDQYMTLRHSIQAQPVTSIAIAAGVGFVLGQMFLRR